MLMRAVGACRQTRERGYGVRDPRSAAWLMSEKTTTASPRSRCR
jgi:hypothetical protein